MESNCKKAELRMAEHEKWAHVKFEAIDEKMKATASVLETRLEGLNELRKQVVSDRNEFLRKETYDEKTKTYDTWIITVEKRFSTSEARAATWTAAIGLFFLLVQVGLHWMEP